MIKNRRTIDGDGIKITACEVDESTRELLSTEGAKLPPLREVPSLIAWLLDDFIIPNWMMLFIIAFLFMFAAICFMQPFENVNDQSNNNLPCTKGNSK